MRIGIGSGLEPKTLIRIAGPTDAPDDDLILEGRLTSPPYGPTLCEGLTGDVDDASVALAQRVVDEVVLVSEDAVRRAIRWLYVEEGVVAEGSAAVSAAALLEGAIAGLQGPVAAVLTGSNIDAARLAPILSGE